MPNIKAFADLVRDQERLLNAYADNATLLAPAEPQRAAVETNLKNLRDVKARQDSFAAQRQEATQELDKLMIQGIIPDRVKDLAESDRPAAESQLRAEWELVKERWK